MMASIPNTRSTPLPVPTAKAPAGEPAPGDFAAQLPIAPGQPIEAVVTPAQIVEPIAPSLPPPESLKDGSTAAPDAAGDAPDRKAETGEDDAAELPPVVIPFPHHQPALPGPQTLPVVDGAGETPAVPATAPAPVPAAKTAQPACDMDGGKTALPVPADADAAPKAEAPEIEAAVKELIQRKQVLAKQVAALPKGAPADAAKPEAIPARAEPLPHLPGQAPATLAAVQAPAPLPAAELPQPSIAPDAARPATAKGEAVSTVDGMRTSDLAVERRLDLNRGSEWLDRLARDIARAASDDAPLRFRLHPQTLGHLQVELQQGERGTAVRLIVETEAARQILADAQPRLAAEARAQGVRIAETHVDLSGSGRHAPGDQRRQDETRQNPMIRTAPHAGPEAAAVRPSRRARLERYA